MFLSIRNPQQLMYRKTGSGLKDYRSLKGSEGNTPIRTAEKVVGIAWE